MGFQLPLGNLQNFHRYVGAVVGGTLEGGEQVFQHEAVFHAAQPVPQTADVPGFDLPHQRVHHLLLRLHLHGKVPVKAPVGIHGTGENVRDRPFQHLQLRLCLLGKLDLFFLHFQRRPSHTHRVVRDALNIRDGIQERIENPVVGDGQAHVGKLYKVRSKSILIAVRSILQGQYLIQDLTVKAPGQAHGKGHGFGGILRHPDGDLVGTLDSHGRRTQQTLVQQLCLVLLRVIGNGQSRKLYKQPVQGQQHSGCRHVEGGMDHRNAHLIAGIGQEPPGMHQSNPIEQRHKNQAAREIEVQVHHSGAAGILVGADGPHNGSDTGSDVLPQDHRDGAAVGHRAGGAHALQDTHRGRRRLNDCRQRRAHRNADKGIGKGHHELSKPGFVFQEFHGPAHELHTGHEGHEAQEDQTDILLFIGIREHIQDDPHSTQQGRQGGGLKQLYKEAVPFQAAEGEDPGCDCGAHVAAHDDPHRLLQSENAGVYEAHHHDRGRGGRLDHRRHRQAQQKAPGDAGAHFGKNGLKLTARGTLQSFSHHIHAKQKQGKPAQQRNQI